MNYKLALELKKAGFPQGDELSCPCQDIPFDERRNLMSKLDCGAEGVYKPTLEELISACAQDRPIDIRIWPTNASAVISGRGYGEGKTAIEAVAKLWLHYKRINIRYI